MKDSEKEMKNKETEMKESRKRDMISTYIPSQWTVRLEEAAPQKEGISMLTRHNLALTYVCTVP
jgi:hypothetical protein